MYHPDSPSVESALRLGAVAAEGIEVEEYARSCTFCHLATRCVAADLTAASTSEVNEKPRRLDVRPKRTSVGSLFADRLDTLRDLFELDQVAVFDRHFGEDLLQRIDASIASAKSA